MKKNNEGFVLTETLVVTIFVLGIFVLIYRNSIPLISEHQKLKNYDDMSTVYSVNLIKNIIVNDSNYENVKKSVDTNGYLDLSNCNDLTNSTLCIKAKELIGIGSSDRIIFTKWDPSAINEKIATKKYLQESGNRGIKEYITYMSAGYNKEETLYDYRVIISRSENDNKYYANLGVQELGNNINLND